MTNRPIVLGFAKYYLPGFRSGGTARTVANIVAELKGDLEFKIVALDRDLGSAQPYNNIAHDKWQSVGGGEVRYLRPAEITSSFLVNLVTEISPDVIYLNSFFDSFSLKLLWARRLKKFTGYKIILAPRGEFSEGALRIRGTKKAIFIWFAKKIGLYNGLTWQASSQIEMDDILKRLDFVDPGAIKIAPDLSQTGKSNRNGGHPPSKPQDNSLRVCFLSRIAQVKNLDFAIKALSQVSATVKFSIFGPIEDKSYWAKCKKLIAKLPANVQVNYFGEIHPSEVGDTLSKHDMLFLPTKGENFGHVIREALSAGLPTLISDQTSWLDLEENDVGWALPLNDLKPFVKVLDDCASWSEGRRKNVSLKAVEYVDQRAGNPEIAQKNLNLFLSTISGNT